MSTPNTEQLAAIEAPGVVFVSAGAGTGKTTVLVERYVRAVCERGLDVERPAHRLGQSPGEGESDPRALDVRLLGAEALERREEQVQVLGPDPRPCVVHLDAQAGA